MLFNKRHYEESEKASMRLEENICDMCSEKWLISWLYKELIKNTKKTSHQIPRWEKVLDRHFTQSIDKQPINTHKDVQHC